MKSVSREWSRPGKEDLLNSRDGLKFSTVLCACKVFLWTMIERVQTGLDNQIEVYSIY
jgi:hypothetical protein